MRWPMLKHTWSTRPTISEVIVWTPFTLLMKLIVSYASACSTDGNLDSARCPISLIPCEKCGTAFSCSPTLPVRTYCVGSFDRTPRFKHEQFLDVERVGNFGNLGSACRIACLGAGTQRSTPPSTTAVISPRQSPSAMTPIVVDFPVGKFLAGQLVLFDGQAASYAIWYLLHGPACCGGSPSGGAIASSPVLANRTTCLHF